MADAAQSLTGNEEDGGSLGLLTQTQPAGPAHSAHPPPPQQVKTYFGSLLLGLFQFVHFNLLGLGCGEKT